MRNENVDMETLRDEMMDPKWSAPLLDKKCNICGKAFQTKLRHKNICSFECKQERVRQHSRFYARVRRYGPIGPRGEQVKPACIICGFDLTTDQHDENGKKYTLCPNHHCMITRNITTLDALAREKVEKELAHNRG